MAQKVVTTYVDDLTGDESTEINTHTLLLDGAGVEIDLTPENHDKLLEAMKPFLQAKGARRVRVNAGTRAKKLSSTPTGNSDTAKIRAWAKDNGYSVNDRGRVPAEIREAYGKAS
jgi:hypothetical protein